MTSADKVTVTPSADTELIAVQLVTPVATTRSPFLKKPTADVGRVTTFCDSAPVTENIDVPVFPRLL